MQKLFPRFHSHAHGNNAVAPLGSPLHTLRGADLTRQPGWEVSPQLKAWIETAPKAAKKKKAA
jgi:hypothetical protein